MSEPILTEPPPPAVGLSCPHCRNPIPVALQTAEASPVACPTCRKTSTVRVFPRLHVADAPKSVQGTLSAEGDATCSFYPELKAEHVCDECGCFMSEKAAVNWGGKTLCLPCLHTLREKKGKGGYRASVRLYDNMALGLIVPFLLLFPLAFFTILTAPVALYYVIRYRKSSRGIVPRSSFRWWLALLLSLAVNGVWLFLIISWIGLLIENITS